ncbi:MAG: formylglycine-generating enzyme family protein [Acidobacteria bacterium]|nr:formylglycine-generating enzyme family protein [Acidobacteriota bacterium]
MNKFVRLLLVVFCLSGSGVLASAAVYRYYGPHVTVQAPWITTIQVLNNGDTTGTFELTVWDADGAVHHQATYDVPPTASLRVVLSAFAGFVPAAGDVLLDPVEGTFVIDTDNARLRPKLAFRYGDSESLCEFFLTGTLGWEYVLPNTVEDHFSWTGMALMNPFDVPLTVVVEAFQAGVMVGQSEIADIPARTKYVRLSDGFWAGLGYTDFDQVRIYSCQRSFPPPMAITGNDAQDRHLFFNAAVTAQTSPCPVLYATDSIVGDLMYVPAGTFQQGRGPNDPCSYSYETPFTHTLTKNLAVMATEVTRGMWAALKAQQASLPSDPTQEADGTGMDNPVVSVTWYEAVLFANLLSVEQGFRRCYYKDDAFTVPVDDGNYTTGPFYCDWSADGYRLPAEGEWEYFCRAGTTTPFSVEEPNFTSCDWYCSAGALPNLESVAWFCANAGSQTHPVAMKDSNPWGLVDVHGNVWEWCWDWYGTYPSGSATDDRGASSGSYRVIRGGCWLYYAYYCRSANRSSSIPYYRYFNFGFRLCRSVY